MGNDAAKAIDLATKITANAESALADLEREMIVMNWPAEFRAILWEAVAHIASLRAQSARDPAGERS